MSKIGVVGGVVALVVAGVNLAAKITEAKAGKCRRDLDDSLRKSENIAADVEEEEKHED